MVKYILKFSNYQILLLLNFFKNIYRIFYKLLKNIEFSIIHQQKKNLQKLPTFYTNLSNRIDLKLSKQVD